ncbi:MaoC family dehydratase N-terminal domain-containing protein [Palleronia sp.]|uniref:FAS1-like dehydratase domain-containing protein n=1 Tax=Palleronia sp. TaxID=1940284 RepID=UPI0035C7C337
MDLNLDHLKSWIGREESASELLTPSLAVRFYATFDRTGSVAAGAEAPFMVHHCLCQPVVPAAELGPDGHPKRGGFLPPVSLPRRMWAGGAIAFHAPPRIGEMVARRSTVDDVSIKQGRSGTLCFVTVTHQYSSDDRAMLTERQDIVYREAPAPGTPTRTPAPAPDGVDRREVATSPELLFRYSALTFNTHRIHYDLGYVTGEEGYPGLVVHGPLQAALLAQYAADLRGSKPARFRFRGMSPAFAGTPLVLHASEADGALKLWSATPGGPVAMEATAEW